MSRRERDETALEAEIARLPDLGQQYNAGHPRSASNKIAQKALAMLGVWSVNVHVV
jgi:hypothetical protein